MRCKELIAAAAVALSVVGSANAMPITPAVVGASPAIQVRGGCGYGEHRGFYSGCRLNRGPRGCPPGRSRIRGICRFVR